MGGGGRLGVRENIWSAEKTWKEGENSWEAGRDWNEGKVIRMLLDSWHLYIPEKDLGKKVIEGDWKFSNFFLETIYHLVVQPLSRVWLFATQWTAARQASLSFIISQSFLKLTSVEMVMPSNHLALCHPLILLPSIFPSIRVFSIESALCLRCPKDWNFSYSISPSNEHPGLHNKQPQKIMD